MATDDKKSIIHRKAMDGREDFDARVMSPSKALRLALAKIAAKMYGMAITVTMVQQVKISNKAIQSETDGDGLLVLLDGATGARGAAQLDCQFLTALIEMQTTGKVRPSQADPRPVTRTDAAIAAPLLDAVLARYDEQLSENDPDFKPVQFRFGDMMEDARALSLALEDPEFDLYRLTLDLEDGAKTGQLTLILPHRNVKPRAEAQAKPRLSADTQTLEDSAMDAQVALDAVLAQVKIPLKDVCAFAPGMVLPLDRDCLQKTELTAVDGKVIARVRMGQMNGMRAVLFVSDDEDEVDQPNAVTDRPDRAVARSLPQKIRSVKDDVVDAEARPVASTPTPVSQAGREKDSAFADAAATKADAAPTQVAEEADELSEADLLQAAQSLQASVRDAREEA